MLHNLRHKPLPRKPKITRPGKRKRVTIIAGFHCSDALLMCADSEQSIGEESKSQTGKIDSFAAGGGIGVMVGGAGDTDLIEYAQYHLKRSLDQNPPTDDNVVSWMEGFARGIWNAVVRPYRGFAPQVIPDAEFLIGIMVRSEYVLYKWERDMIRPVPRTSHSSVGVGIVQSTALLAELDPFYLPAHQMLLYAVRAMLRVKRLVQGCGGNTEVALLMKDGFIMRPATRQIDAIEYLTDELDQFLLERPMAFVAGEVNPDADANLRGQTEVLKRFRARYEKTIPDLFSWYHKQEIRF